MSDQIFNQINSDIKDAMKAKEKDRLEALRFLKSKLLENKTSKKPQAEMDVVISHVKKTKDSLDTFPEGHDQREKTLREISFLEVYLPKQLSEEEVRQMITDIVAKLEAPNMGAIMKEIMPLTKGRFDGKKINQLVNEALKK